MTAAFLLFLSSFECLKPGDFSWSSFLGHVPTCFIAGTTLGVVIAYIVRDQLDENECIDQVYDWFLNNIPACTAVTLKPNEKNAVCCYVLAKDGYNYMLGSGKVGAEQYRVLREILEQDRH